jgi:hypothetical protein
MDLIDRRGAPKAPWVEQGQSTYCAKDGHPSQSSFLVSTSGEKPRTSHRFREDTYDYDYELALSVSDAQTTNNKEGKGAESIGFPLYLFFFPDCVRVDRSIQNRPLDKI